MPTPPSICSLSAIRDDIAEVLEHSNPSRPDYSTDVELEQLERWQEGIAAAESQRDALLVLAKELVAWADRQDPDELVDVLLGSAIIKARAAIAAAKGDTP